MKSTALNGSSSPLMSYSSGGSAASPATNGPVPPGPSESSADGFQAPGAAGPKPQEISSIPPLLPTVSGGTGSLLPYAKLDKEGRRIVSEAIPAAQISSLLGGPAKDPIRVYAGVGHAGDAQSRAALALEELKRLQAFDRKTLVLVTPTGSGAVDSAFLGANEYMGRGDVATAVVQYGEDPSLVTILKGHEARARATSRALLTLVDGEVKRRSAAGLPVPRVVLFGESLGAWASEDLFLHESAADILNPKAATPIAAALWAGTPHPSKLHKELFGDSHGAPRAAARQFNGAADLAAAGSTQGTHLFFLNHPDDPVTRVGLNLLWHKPADWPLDKPWKPVSTFFGVLKSLPGAVHVTPGKFEAKMHDYRADVPAFVRQAYGYTDITDAQVKAIIAGLETAERPKPPTYLDPIAAAHTGPSSVSSAALLPSNVSGGKNSLLPYATLDEVGRRFVSQVVPASEISRVMQSPAQEPIRIYAGLHSAPSNKLLARRTVEEMAAKGAFDKAAVMLFCTTGSGWAPEDTVEAAEFLTRGNVATVALQYNNQASVLTVLEGREPRAHAMFADLLDAVNVERIRRTAAGLHVPKLFATGESLGAWGGQDALMSQSIHRIAEYGGLRSLDGALWTGTPHASRLHHLWLGEGHVGEGQLAQQFDGIADLQGRDIAKTRFFFINHPNDPIPRLGVSLLWHKPQDWPTDGERWRPGLSFLRTASAMPHSLSPQAGNFVANMHDYRLDKIPFINASVVRLTFGQAVTAERANAVLKAMESRELARANA